MGENAVNDFKAFLISTSPLHRLIAAAVFTVAFAAVMFQFVYGSQKRQLDQARKTGGGLQKNISSQEAQLKQLKAQTSGALMAAPSHRSALDLAGNTLFTSGSLRDFVNTGLTDLATGAGLVNIAINEEQSEEALASLDNGESIKVRRLPVSLTAVGTYQNFTDFSAQLWMNNHLMAVQSLKLLSLDPMGNELSVTLNLLCYYEERIE
jgi:Tfp pilus assembly protein PilO